MQPGYGVLPVCVGCGEYVETETAIRCPACHKKLNTTQEEFNEQIEVTYMWIERHAAYAAEQQKVGPEG